MSYWAKQFFSLCAIAVVSLTASSLASASSVSFSSEDSVIRFQADAGESNGLNVLRASSKIVLSDSAGIDSVSGCSKTDAFTAKCSYDTTTPPAIEAQLGDGDDTSEFAANLRTIALTVDGGTGADVITILGSGTNTLIGGADSDTVTGGTGHDTIYGDGTSETDGEADVLSGGSSGDTIFGGGSNDALSGDAGSDELHGGSESDQLNGDDGDDTLDGGQGADSLSGGEGGKDFADYTSRTLAVTTSIGDGANDGENEESDDIHSDIEGIDGGLGDDFISGDSSANTLRGNAGNDTVTGLGGSDVLRGNAGDDLLLTRDGEIDSVNCGGRTDTVEADSELLDTVHSNCEITTFAKFGEDISPPVTETPTSTDEATQQEAGDTISSPTTEPTADAQTVTEQTQSNSQTVNESNSDSKSPSVYFEQICRKKTSRCKVKVQGQRVIRGMIVDRSPSSGLKKLSVNVVIRRGKTCLYVNKDRLVKAKSCAQAAEQWTGQAETSGNVATSGGVIKWSQRIIGLKTKDRITVQAQATDTANNTSSITTRQVNL